MKERSLNSSKNMFKCEKKCTWSTTNSAMLMLMLMLLYFKCARETKNKYSCTLPIL